MMKRIKGVIILLSAALLTTSIAAQANVPSNCAVDSNKLGELARAAHHLPRGFDKDIFGNWQHSQRVMGHDVLIKVGKYNNGQFKIRLTINGPLKRLDEEKPMMICTSNRRAFEIFAHLNGENQNVPVEVLAPRQIQVLDGRLSGLYNKR